MYCTSGMSFVDLHQHGETFDKFMVRLQKQARHCNFGATLEENLLTN